MGPHRAGHRSATPEGITPSGDAITLPESGPSRLRQYFDSSTIKLRSSTTVVAPLLPFAMYTWAERRNACHVILSKLCCPLLRCSPRDGQVRNLGHRVIAAIGMAFTAIIVSIALLAFFSVVIALQLLPLAFYMTYLVSFAALWTDRFLPLNAALSVMGGSVLISTAGFWLPAGSEICRNRNNSMFYRMTLDVASIMAFYAILRHRLMPFDVARMLVLLCAIAYSGQFHDYRWVVLSG